MWTGSAEIVPHRMGIVTLDMCIDMCQVTSTTYIVYSKRREREKSNVVQPWKYLYASIERKGQVGFCSGAMAPLGERHFITSCPDSSLGCLDWEEVVEVMEDMCWCGKETEVSWVYSKHILELHCGWTSRSRKILRIIESWKEKKKKEKGKRVAKNGH